MSQTREFIILRLGIFLVSLGAGWFFFSSLRIPLGTLALILVALGIVLVATSLLSWRRPTWRARGLISACVWGIVASLLLSSGVAVVQNLAGSGGSGPYTAQEVRVYSGAVPEGSVSFEVENINGAVIVSGWDRSFYSVNLTVRARDTLQGNGESNLVAFKTSLDVSSAAGAKRLVLKYDFPLMAGSTYAVEVRAFLPANSLSLNLASSNGRIVLSKINGTNVKASTSNGQQVLDRVYVDELTVSTSNGAIEGTIDASKATLSTSNGPIRLVLPALRSGNYNFQTSNGMIDLTVPPSPRVGYSLDLSTSNAAISIDLTNLNYSVDQRTAKKAQTTDFNSKAVQLTIKGVTSNGNINVDTS